MDQRKHPIYPLVHAPKHVVKAYNPQLKSYNATLPNKMENSSQSATPNILFVLIESFGPSPQFYDRDFILKEGVLETGPLYIKSYVPTMHTLAEIGVSFSGLSSISVPTLNAWIALLGGEQQQRLSNNVISSLFNEVDDLPSSMRDNGY